MNKINSNLFKLAMSKYATGVTIITIDSKEKYFGKTVNSFASLSLKPPLILFSLDKKSSSLNIFKKSSFFGINILSKNQKKLSNYFSMKNPLWKNTPFTLSKNNVPLVNNCVANIDCKKIKLINQGDHIIFICKINTVKINEKKKPLIYLNSKYI
jgi:flavin reductase (DIM6/NTAB) family NADH-FMN oxidoreductase RutF